MLLSSCASLHYGYHACGLQSLAAGDEQRIDDYQYLDMSQFSRTSNLLITYDSSPDQHQAYAMLVFPP